MKANKIQNRAFTLVEIMIVVAIIGLLAVIAIPNFVKARTTAQRNACINNLRQIDGAKHQWALEERARGDVAPTPANIAPYIGRVGSVEALESTVVCPAGGAGASFSTSYDINAVTNPPTCRIGGTPLPGGLGHILL